MFNALVTAFEATRRVVIEARHCLSRPLAEDLQTGNRALLSLADPAKAITREDQEDLEAARYCEQQLEELMVFLLSQIQD